MPQAEDDLVRSGINDESVIRYAGYLKTVRRTQDQLAAVCPPIDRTYLEILILVSEMPTTQTHAMVDGVLLWLGLKVPETAAFERRNHVIDSSDFIVTEPGRRAEKPIMNTNRNRDDVIHDEEFDSI